MPTSIPRLLIFLSGVACIASRSVVAADVIVPDLKKLADDVGATRPQDGTVRWNPDAKGRPALFATRVVWLKDVNFTEGTIECDILGKSAPRGSNFPGLVFHELNDTTFDCVYFRPFNFRADNPENASHAVQYVSVPVWPWPKLRRDKTGQYEKPIAPPPDGDEWFHAKLVVVGRRVSVFVNGATKACLDVELLNDRAGGRIGISGGDAGDGGYFANLKIIPHVP